MRGLESYRRDFLLRNTTNGRVKVFFYFNFKFIIFIIYNNYNLIRAMVDEQRDRNHLPQKHYLGVLGKF